MGSGASTVKPSSNISCVNSSVSEDAHVSLRREPRQTEEPLSERSLREQLERCQRCLTMAEENCQSSTQEAGRLERLVTELEGQNFDLHDRIKSLEQRLSDKEDRGFTRVRRVLDDTGESDDEEEEHRPFIRHSQRRMSSTSPRSILTETIQAKDTLIKELERQLEETKAEMLKLRLKWRRKLKHCSAQLSECKQTSALRIMELRQELLRMTEEKRRLDVLSSETPEGSGDNQSAASSPNSPPRAHGLIVELSQQVADQSDKIKRLERSIAERDRFIKQLEYKIVQNRPTQGNLPHQQQNFDKRDRSDCSGNQAPLSSDSLRQVSASGGRDSGLESDGPPTDSAIGNHRRSGSPIHGSLPTLSERDVVPLPPRPIPAETLSCASSDITEDCNLDAESLDDSDDDFPSPVHSAHNRPKSAHYSAGRPKLNR